MTEVEITSIPCSVHHLGIEWDGQLILGRPGRIVIHNGHNLNARARRLEHEPAPFLGDVIQKIILFVHLELQFVLSEPFLAPSKKADSSFGRANPEAQRRVVLVSACVLARNDNHSKLAFVAELKPGASTSAANAAHRACARGGTAKAVPFPV